MMYSYHPFLTWRQSQDLADCAKAARVTMAAVEEAQRIYKAKQEADEREFFAAGFADLKERERERLSQTETQNQTK